MYDGYKLTPEGEEIYKRKIGEYISKMTDEYLQGRIYYWFEKSMDRMMIAFDEISRSNIIRLKTSQLILLTMNTEAIRRGIKTKDESDMYFLGQNV